MSSITHPVSYFLDKYAETYGSQGIEKDGRNYRLWCPIHGGRSLIVGEGSDGRLLIDCKQCKEPGSGYKKAILDEMGLTWAELAPTATGTTKAKKAPAKTKKKAPARVAREPEEPASLQRLSEKTGLSVDFLRSLGVWDFNNVVQIRYTNPDGSPAVRQRLRRTMNGGNRFAWLGDRKEGDPIPYVTDWEKLKGDVFAVEGESDTWTLHQYGAPALGITGTDGAAHLSKEHLTNVERIFIVQERDHGGPRFVQSVTDRLRNLQWDGNAYVVHPWEGAKDINDMHTQGHNVAQWAREAIEAAEQIDISPGMLAIPKGWEVGEKATYTVKGKEEQERTKAFNGVAYISDILTPVEPDQPEKLRLKFKRRGQWKEVTALAADVFTKSQLQKMRNNGLPVTSENAGKVVRWLDDYFSLNEEEIPETPYITRFGWVDDECKVFALADSDNVRVEVDPMTKRFFTPKGTLSEWLEIVKPLRGDDMSNYLGRAAMNASLGAPLMKKLRLRPFIMHSWTTTRGGKTAGLRVAQSVWADPIHTLLDFNDTVVAIEADATIRPHLPLCINELQLAANDDRKKDLLVYMIEGGKGRGRGRTDGTKNQPGLWHTLALTTGEEPLSRSNSFGGFNTRVVEITAARVIDNDEYAKRLHIDLQRCYGTAGPAFIQQAIQAEEQEPGYLQGVWDRFYAQLMGEKGDLIEEHYRAAIFLTMTDYLSGMWIFGEKEQKAEAKAAQFGDLLLRDLKAEVKEDEFTAAYKYLFDVVTSNGSRFYNPLDEEREIRDYWGFQEEYKGKKTIFISPSHFERIMRDGGFNHAKHMKEWARREWCISTEEGGKTRQTIKRMAPYGNSRTRFIGVYFDQAI